MTDYIETCDTFAFAVSAALDKAIASNLTIRDCLAISLGVMMAEYERLGNNQGARAIEECHKVFLEEAAGIS